MVEIIAVKAVKRRVGKIALPRELPAAEKEAERHFAEDGLGVAPLRHGCLGGDGTARYSGRVYVKTVF